jgi:hypothetical protein
MPGIEYKVSVSGINMLGVQGETKNFSFKVMPKTMRSDSEGQISSSQLVLKGPAMTLSSAASYIEARFVSCDPQIMVPPLNVSTQSVDFICNYLAVDVVLYHRSRFESSGML